VKRRFDSKDGLVKLPVRVYGPAGRMLLNMALDTGATRTLIRWEPLMELGYDPAAVRSRVQMLTASSEEFAPLVQTDKIAALGRERFGMAVLCHDLPEETGVDGLLGLDFLRDSKLTLDFREGIIGLK